MEGEEGSGKEKRREGVSACTSAYAVNMSK